MTRHIRRSAPRPRTTLALTGTVRHIETHLSFDAGLALAYCTAYMGRVSSLKVSAAALIRTALLHFAVHLDTADAKAEFAEVKHASSAPVVDDDKQLLANLRLAAVPLDEPLPSFYWVRVGPAAIAAMEDFEARVEATVNSELANRRPHRKVQA